MDESKANPANPANPAGRKPRVLICVPVYKPFNSKIFRKTQGSRALLPKGLLHPMTQKSIENTIAHSGERIDFGLTRIVGDACLTRARSLLYAEYKNAKKEADIDFLWMVDADVSWEPDALERLIERDEALIGAAYSFRERDAEKARITASRFRPDRILHPDGLVEVDGINGGFMLIKDTLLSEMEAAYPELAFMTNPPRMLPTFGFWNFAITPYPEWIQEMHPELEGQNEFVSEDWAFTHRARAIGAVPWIDVSVNLGHWDGNKVFRLPSFKPEETKEV